MKTYQVTVWFNVEAETPIDAHGKVMSQLDETITVGSNRQVDTSALHERASDVTEDVICVSE